MLEEEYCKVLCQVDLKTKDVTDFKTAIQRQYRHNWIIDNLPAASILDTDQYVSTQYVGYPVGESIDDLTYYRSRFWLFNLLYATINHTLFCIFSQVTWRVPRRIFCTTT